MHFGTATLDGKDLENSKITKLYIYINNLIRMI